MLNIPLRPEGFETIRKEIRQATGVSGKWDKLYERSHTYVDSVTLHNISSQTVYISTKEDPSEAEYDDLHAFSYINIEANIERLHVKRTVDPPTGQPNPYVVLLVTYYTPKQMEDAYQLYSKSILSVLGAISPQASQAAMNIQAAPVKVVSLTPSSGGEGSGLPEVKTQSATASGFLGGLFEVLNKLFGGGK